MGTLMEIMLSAYKLKEQLLAWVALFSSERTDKYDLGEKDKSDKTVLAPLFGYHLLENDISVCENYC